ncbi:transporter [Vibrio sp. SCSIO 43135]|uniref:Transporter n=1 Tax=Vibrio paucivorans TaxID=2829489 RepID=A0A9X3CHG2_9VIBR|nr:MULTISPECIES: transporter [Vibrio]MCW8335811.1 transporter [Vibrio paucivorans]USD42228.1 transporter [Vibrio sp. SCSIO 43135]
MEHQEAQCVEFDYTSFLGASCSKKWTFLEAMSTFAPIFSLMWRDNIKELSTPQDRLWEAALKSLSASRSDESNLVTLCELAKYEGISQLKLVMPYTLDSDQIEMIKSKSSVQISPTSHEEFLIELNLH